jgi:tRNA acetyltransferase TAN1
VIGGSTYRVTVEKRHSKISSAELISRIADGIQGKVSLEEPAWEVLVEVLGAETGVSLVRPGDVISVEKLKRASE